MDRLDQLLNNIPRYSPSERLFQEVQIKINEKESEDKQIEKLSIPFMAGLVCVIILDIAILLNYSASLPDAGILAQSVQTNTNIMLYE
jgi:hypothetical protein